MKARCPKCLGSELRIHSSLNAVSFRRGLFGGSKMVASPVAWECSCGDCGATFVVRDGSVELTPIQKAYDLLAEAKERAGRPAPSAPTAPDLPRPAPDPRVRRRDR